MKNTFDFHILEDIFIIDSENTYETQLIQQCFDFVGVFVAALDRKGNFILINKKGKEMLGCTNNSIIGENFIRKYIVPEEQQNISELFNKIIVDKPAFLDNIQYHLRTNENELKIIESKNVTIRDKHNHILGLLISGEDVTGYVNNQRHLQNDISHYRKLANNVPDINLFLFDKELRFIIAEGKEMKNNGLHRHDLEGKKLSELQDEEIKKIWAPLFKPALEGHKVSTEYHYNDFYYLIWVLPIRLDNNNEYSGMAITQNITEEKQAEQKLKKSKEDAEQANRAKSEFLASVSHEIRTPLNAIIGFTEQLMQTELNCKQIDYLNIIDKSSEHLLSLINDILLLSKIEARKITFDNAPFKIAHAIKYAHKTLSAKAREKNLDFTYEIDDTLNIVLMGDSFRLQQVLINALNNAIKFTDAGYVTLKCTLKEETETTIKAGFDITDTGIGIDPEKLATIFEQFKQADSAITKKYGGTGLGLTICKNIIEMQNGSLSISSQENVGTTLSFIIPYKKGNETDTVHPETGTINREKLKNKKILLVDDDSVNRLLGKTILSKFNCTFDLAINGKETIEKLNKEKYDIVLLDIHMPDISGLDIAEFVRKKKKDHSTKIIAVTAAAVKNDLEGYYNVGIDDFLIKPYREINLFNKICEVLKIQDQPYRQPKTEIILKEEVNPKHYNLAELKKMSGGDESFIAKMITIFIENSENTIDMLQYLLKEKNWKEIGELAHKSLPSYRHLEVENIVSDLVKLKENTLVKPNYPIVPELTKKTITGMKKLIVELKTELDS